MKSGWSFPKKIFTWTERGCSVRVVVVGRGEGMGLKKKRNVPSPPMRGEDLSSDRV